MCLSASLRPGGLVKQLSAKWRSVIAVEWDDTVLWELLSRAMMGGKNDKRNQTSFKCEKKKRFFSRNCDNVAVISRNVEIAFLIFFLCSKMRLYQ